MKNYRGGNTIRQVVTATATRTSGVPCIEDGFVGIPETTVSSGARFTLRRDGEYELAYITSAAKGDTILINRSTQALTRVAGYAAAPASGLSVFGRVTAVPGDPNTQKVGDPEPKSGKMWVDVRPTEVTTA